MEEIGDTQRKAENHGQDSEPIKGEHLLATETPELCARSQTTSGSNSMEPFRGERFIDEGAPLASLFDLRANRVHYRRTSWSYRVSPSMFFYSTAVQSITRLKEPMLEVEWYNFG